MIRTDKKEHIFSSGYGNPERIARLLRYLSLLSIALVFISVLVVRIFWAFKFPVPWNDETAFLAQAEALSRTGSLFVPALNEERVVMWMPPSYMVTLSIIYKIFGYSFDLSRWVSATFYLLSFATLLIVSGKIFSKPMRYIAFFLVSISYLSPYGLATANICRMESMYTLMFVASMLAAVQRQYLLSLSIILASSTIHFNAVYFLLPSILIIGFHIFSRSKISISAYEYFALIISLLAIGLYAVYSALNMQGFIEDMRFQFNYKLGSPIMDGTKGLTAIGIVASIGIFQIISERRLNEGTMLTCYGISFLMLAYNGHNMWYSHSYVLGYLLPILGLLHQAHNSNTLVQKTRFKLILASTILIFPFILYGFKKNPQFEPMWPRTELFQKDFISDLELTRVENFLYSLPKGKTVSFGYTGVEPFFFNAFSQMNGNWSINGKSVTSPLPPRKIDFAIKCDSSLFPSYVFFFDWDGFKRQGQDSGCEISKAR